MGRDRNKVWGMYCGKEAGINGWMDASLTFFNGLRDSGGGPYVQVHVQTVLYIQYPSTNIQATARYLDD